MKLPFFVAALAVLAALCAPASAQVGVGTSVAPDSFGFGSAEEKRREPPPPVEPAALAASLVFDATTWARVELSTSAPQEFTSLMRKGYYRRELLQLVLVSRESGMPFKVAQLEREKGARLREMAAKRGIDFEKLYDESLALERRMEERYLPAVLSVSVSTQPPAGWRPKRPSGARE